MITILSEDQRYRAQLEVVDLGVRVTLSRAAGPIDIETGVGQMFRVLHRTVVALPFHVACDTVYESVRTMRDERSRLPLRSEVFLP